MAYRIQILSSLSILLCSSLGASSALIIEKKTAEAVKSGQLVRVKDLELHQRLFAPIVTDHRVAAVTVLDRLLHCFIERAEVVNGLVGPFLVRLPELIKDCDGPLADVAFTTPNGWHIDGCTLDTLAGFIRRITESNIHGAAAAARQVNATLLLQKAKFSLGRAAAKKNTRTDAEGRSLRWSIPLACWVRTDGEQFHDPCSTLYDSRARQFNLVETIKSHAKDSDENWNYFLSDLEDYVNYPYASNQKDWITVPKPRTAHDKGYEYEQYEKAFSGEWTLDRKIIEKRDLRLRQIERIVDAARFNKDVVWQFQQDQDSRKVVTQEQVYVDPQTIVLPALLTLEGGRQNAAPVAPIVLEIQDNPYDIDDLLALPAPGNAQALALVLRARQAEQSKGSGRPRIEEIE